MKEGDIIKKWLYISDLDDTLLNGNAELEEEVAVKLNSLINGGLNFTYITARDWASSNEIMNRVNISIPVAVCNGGAVIDFMDGKIINGFFIKNDIAKRILNIAAGNHLFPNLVVASGELICNCYISPELQYKRDIYLKKARKYKKYTIIKQSVSEINFDNVISISIVDKKEKLEDFMSQVKSGIFREVKINTFSDPFEKSLMVIDIVSSEVSKGIAANVIANITGIKSNKYIMAFGNGLNDIELLKIANTRIGVGNVPDVLKDILTLNIKYNEGKSVVNFIEQHLEESNKKI